MRQLTFQILIAGLLIIAGVSQSLAGKRVALVIGNAAYKYTAPLANPINDARDIASALKRLGFNVMLERDLTKVGLDRAFGRFAQAMRGADAALFYYAGHGMQYQGINYLVPVDATLEDEAVLPYEMAQLDNVLADMARVKGVRIAVLDACRDNPLEKKLKRRLARSRGITPTRGFARVKRTEGTLVAFATQTGDVAAEGDGRNSPFTTALLKHIETPALEVGALFRRVASAVNRTTNGKQTPELSISLLGEFFFADGREGPKVSVAQETGGRLSAAAEAWSVIQGTKFAGDLEAFILEYPDSFFAKLAQARLARLLEERLAIAVPPKPVSPGDADSRKASVHNCDRLAADPHDPRRVTAGVAYDSIRSKEAIRACRLAVDTRPDVVRFSYQLGRALEKGGSYEESVRWYRKAAEKGDARAMTDLATSYGIGLGVDKNDREAVRWYRKAAKLGDLRAMNNLGVRYQEGRGVRKDEDQALRWYRKAAQKGFAPAMQRFGWMYQQGLGIRRDDREAVRWYRKAAQQGLSEAMVSLGLMYERGRGVGQDRREAVRWYRKSTENGNGRAMLLLGYMYLHGHGVGQDERKAVRWFRESAEKGEHEAMSILGTLYKRGQGVDQDKREALRWYRRAAAKGNTTAMIGIGVMYLTGDGVGQDRLETAHWYRKAADKGNAGAMVLLGLMYGDGMGVGQNDREALHWYQKAAEKGSAWAMYNLAQAHEDGKGTSTNQKAAARYMFDSLRGGHEDAVKEMTTNARSWSKPFRRELQRLMKIDGIYSGPIDGEFGSGTKRAVEALAKK